MGTANDYTHTEGEGKSVTYNSPIQSTKSDMIYRQAAIDALCKAVDAKGTYDGEWLYTDEFCKVVNDLPSAQPERLTDDDFETIRIHLNAYKEKLCNQQRWREAEEYQRIIDRFMAFASAQPETCAYWDRESNICALHRPSAQPEPQWIPCDEGLPFSEYGESDNVLTTCGYRNVEDTSIRWVKTLYFNGEVWCYPTGEVYEQKVYAWMPLPKTYRGETDGIAEY